MCAEATSVCEVAIIGAGPVGLLLANLLGARGLRTLLVEKRTELPATSMAIGITPPSMEILSTLGLHDRFAENGVRIREAGVHDERGVLGRLSFERVASPFNYVLSIPQRRTVEILRDAVRGQNTVEYREGWSFESFDEDDGHITAHLHREIPHARESVSARILVGCDGHRSTVRNCAGLRMSRKLYPVSFAMGEFLDRSGLGEEARLYFTPEGSLESFPLPGGRRRWITMLREEPSDQAEHLAQRVTAVTGFEPDLADLQWMSSFQPVRRLCASYHRGGAVLCGDAAHVMSPIGGQGMNTGLADAEYLAEALVRILRHGEPQEHWLTLYERYRRRAFATASMRAAAGMWLGTRAGRMASRARSLLLRHVLLRPRMSERLAVCFAMLNVPYRRTALAPEFA